LCSVVSLFQKVVMNRTSEIRGACQ
jgi:hypothetical protein